MQTTNFAWDLSDLFTGVDDPKIEESLASLAALTAQFAERWRGKINTDQLTAESLLAAVTEYETLVSAMVKPICYASLLFSSDTSNPKHGALLQHIQERQSEMSVQLIFFELEMLAAKPEVLDPILADERLQDYRHFIHASRLFRDFRLSEPEEKIIEEKANTGIRAWERLFEESVSAIQFKVVLDGQERTMTEPEVLALLREPDRETRAAAATSLTNGLTENSRLLTYIFNTLVLEKAINDRLRGYAYPEQARHISNELDKETVDTVVEVCKENYPLVARYYRTKREMMGLDKLTHYDRYAPLFDTKEEYSFDQARETVLDSFGRFSPEMADAAEQFFTNRWIDAQPRSGKRGGAFCMYVSPDHHPYVLMSYLNRKDDIMTLGHELGHGVHAYLSRGQSYVNFSTALPVAELASTFGEMLVFDKLVSTSSLDDKMALYAEKIEGVFATVFRQAAMFSFEQELHKARRELGELTSEEINDIWQESIQSMFADSVELGDDHKCWWMYVSHFVGSPFYVYAYSFGELLVMALYSMYRREGGAFVPKYVEMLKTGGSCAPEELLSRVGVSIRDPEFWRGGMKVVEQLVADFEEIHKQWKAQSR